MPLSLDSQHWAALNHAYGSARETPGLLKAILGPESAHAWSELYGSIAHQGSIYSATYAAVPVLMAQAQDVPDPFDWIVFVGFVAAGHAEDPVPDDLRSEFDESVRMAHQMCLAHLRRSGRGRVDRVYLLQSAAATAGRVVLARVLVGLEDGEFQLDCKSCGKRLFIQALRDRFVAYSEDPVRVTDSHSTLVVPKLGVAESSHSEALGWMLAILQDEDWEIRNALLNLFGEVVCPVCGYSCNLYTALEADAAIRS